MEILGLHGTVLALVLCGAALAQGVIAHGRFGQRSGLYLGMAMAGLGAFAMDLLLSQVAAMVGDPDFAHVPGWGLVWAGVGAILTTYGVPSFAAEVFGRRRGVVLWIIRAGTLVMFMVVGTLLGGPWGFNVILVGSLRGMLFASVGVPALLLLLGSGQIADRRLAKGLWGFVVLVLFLLPLIIMESFGLVEISGFPNVGLILLIVAMSLAVMGHISKALFQPRFSEGGRPSAYALERFGISPRELEIIQGALVGKGNKEIAQELSITTKTVENHLYNIYQKAGVSSRIQLFNLFKD